MLSIYFFFILPFIYIVIFKNNNKIINKQLLNVMII